MDLLNKWIHIKSYKLSNIIYKFYTLRYLVYLISGNLLNIF